VWPNGLVAVCGEVTLSRQVRKRLRRKLERVMLAELRQSWSGCIGKTRRLDFGKISEYTGVRGLQGDHFETVCRAGEADGRATAVSWEPFAMRSEVVC
jgi:hypothetical protein